MGRRRILGIGAQTGLHAWSPLDISVSDEQARADMHLEPGI
jgi:hypothetical protein